jgi:hypothetical protein
MKVRILIPGRKVDDVSYRCEKLRRRGHAFRTTSVVSDGRAEEETDRAALTLILARRSEARWARWGRWRWPCRRDQKLRSVHSDCMGCGIEPRKIRHRRGREFSFARRQHVRHRYARC